MSNIEKWHEEYGFSQAKRVGDLLFCSGQVGVDVDGAIPSDVERQFDCAFGSIGAVLAEYGACAADLVEWTSFHVNYPEHMQQFMAAKARFQGAARPAWTAVGVAALAMPGILVEIKAIARIGSTDAARE